MILFFKKIFVKNKTVIEEMVISPFPETIDEFSFTRSTFTPTETPEREKEEDEEEEVKIKVKLIIFPDQFLSSNNPVQVILKLYT
jgi:hypothetical protein